MTTFLITGSRKVTDYAKVRVMVWQVLDEHIKSGDTIIQGGAMGIDAMARLWAEERKVRLGTFLPLDKSNKANYLMRNAEMVGACDRVIAFWDGESRGTKFTIDYAKARDKLLTIVSIDDKNCTLHRITQEKL